MPLPNLIRGKQPLGSIGYIGVGNNPEEFTWSMIQLTQFCYEYASPSGTYIHMDRSVLSGQVGARNELVKKMQGDWLLQIDSDESFDPDLAMRMIYLFESLKLDVLTGLYHYKQPPHNPVIYQYVEGAYRAIVNWDHADDIRLLPIDAAGGGCLMVRRSVFDRIRNEQGAQPFDNVPGYGTDDFNFFERCRLLGIKSYCAPKIEVQHLQMRGCDSRDYNPALYECTTTSKRVCEALG